MKLRTPQFYKDFKCIAGDCTDSCCQGWDVDADEISLKYYKNLETCEIKERIERVLSKDEFDNTIFTLTKNKRCPFLNDNNLCDMHIAIGGEHTPYTCRTFPRFINNFGSLSEMGISFSCPVASDMMWNLKEKFDFCDEINELPPTLNDIDAQTYFSLLQNRKKAYEIIQEDNTSIKEKMLLLLDFGEKIQKELYPYTEGKENIDFIEIFNNPEVINEEWIEKVKNFTEKRIENKSYNENIMMYFIFRYFMQAVFDKDVLSKIKMAVVGILIVTYFGNDSWTIHLWSKETEHSDVNMKRYKNLLLNAKTLNVCELKKRINSL